MKNTDNLFYTAIGITLFLVHAPLLYYVRPYQIETDPLQFLFQNIANIEITETIIVSCLKAIGFSLATIKMLSMLKKSDMKQALRRTFIITFALLDGFAFLLYTNWMDIVIKNQITSFYYAISFTVLIGAIAFLTLETGEKQEQNNTKTEETGEKKTARELAAKGYSQRRIAEQMGISASTVNRILNN